MKRSSLILLLSVVVNGALFALVLQPRERDSRPISTKTRVEKSAPTAGLAGKSNAAVAKDGGPSPAPGTVKLWQALDSSDLKVFAARLRAAGFPEEMVKNLVTRRIFKIVYGIEDQIRSSLDPKKYWRLPEHQINSFSGAELEKRAKAANQMSEDILGTKNLFAGTGDLYDDYRFGFLPEEKRKALQGLNVKLGERMKALNPVSNKPGQVYTKEQRAQLAEANKQYQAEIDQVLGPADGTEFKMRQSPTAEVVRQDLKTFRASEAEYRALFAVYDTALQSRSDLTDNAAQNMGELQKWIRTSNDAQIQQILGPDRYADLQQALEPGAAKLNMITDRLGLPLSAAAQVTSVQKDITQRAQQVQQDTSLTVEQRAQKLSDLQAEAQSSITTTLGNDGFNAYKQYSGSWIAKLKSSGKK